MHKNIYCRIAFNGTKSKATSVSKKRMVNQAVKHIRSMQSYAATKIILKETRRRHGKMLMLLR